MSNFKKQIFLIILTTIIIGIVDVHAAVIGNIDSANHNAYVCYEISCTQHGTVTLLPSGGVSGVTLVDNIVTGYAWGNALGWINFSPSNSGVSYSSTTRELSGYAWSESSGWINFRPSNSGTLAFGIPVGVSINGNNEWYGWAFATGKNGGWVKFDCSSNATCVKVLWGTSTTTPVIVSPPQTTSSGGSYFVNTTITNNEILLNTATKTNDIIENTSTTTSTFNTKLYIPVKKKITNLVNTIEKIFSKNEPLQEKSGTVSTSSIQISNSNKITTNSVINTPVNDNLININNKNISKTKEAASSTTDTKELGRTITVYSIGIVVILLLALIYKFILA